MKKVLLISKIPTNNASTIADHVQAIVDFSDHDVRNVDVDDPEMLTQIQESDCILLHYSVIAYPYRSDKLISSQIRLKITTAGKPVLHIVQDEQRNVLERFRYFETLGVRHVFSVVPETVIDQMYSPSIRSFSVSTLLTGYLPLNLEEFRHIEWDRRKVDISYRARRLPEWYGRSGSIKSEVSDRLNEFKHKTDISIDSSCEEGDRLYGHSWIEFLCNSKVAVGTESGSSVLDMDGRFLENWQDKSTSGNFDPVEPVQANYAAISPRIFEYAAAKCLLALTPGEYSGILVPGVHYFELQPNLSNISDLILLMNNESQRNLMIKNSYNDLILSQKYGYEQMVNQIDYWISHCLKENLSNNEDDLENTSLPKISEKSLNEKIAIEKHQIRPKLLQLLINKYNAFFKWSLTRQGVTRNFLRFAYRLGKSFLDKNFFTAFRYVLYEDSFSRREFKDLFLITRSLIECFKLIPELIIIKHEETLLKENGLRLRYQESEHSVWITWPESPFRNEYLTGHPKLDPCHYPESKGVWLTRGDYSEISRPQNLIQLSRYHFKSEEKSRAILRIYVNASG
jgi:hypothetical protein